MTRARLRCGGEGRQDLRRAARAGRRERHLRSRGASPPCSARTAPARARCSASCRRWSTPSAGEVRWGDERAGARLVAARAHRLRRARAGPLRRPHAPPRTWRCSPRSTASRSAAARARPRCWRAWGWARRRPTRRRARSRAGCCSGWRWRARWCTTRRCCCSTSRRSALDPAGAAWLASELAAERAAGRIVVLVTHDLDAAAARRRSGGHPAARAGRLRRDARRRLRRRGGARAYEERTRA